MSESKACYRKLRKYKYQLIGDYTITIDVSLDDDIILKFITLTTSGDLTIRNRYAWDGPSGPTFDTKTFMRSSLVHDALYQLMREEKLGLEYREYVDDLLKKNCREDGMFRFRAWYVHKFVRMFGKKSASPSQQTPAEVICAP